MENKNTPKKLWFKAKRYGWGWQPATWQGWVITLIYISCILIIAFHAVSVTQNANGTSETFLWNYLPPLFLLSFIMIWVCYKTGEKPRWRWG